MRISDPNAPHVRPHYIAPGGAAVLGVIVGCLIGGAGMYIYANYENDESKCVNVIRTADNIIYTDEQIFTQFAISTNPTSDEIKWLKAQRQGYVNYYDQNKGACQ